MTQNISNNSCEHAITNLVNNNLSSISQQSNLLITPRIDAKHRNISATITTDNVTRKKNRKSRSKSFGSFVQKVVKHVSEISLHSSRHDQTDDAPTSCHTTASTTCSTNSYKNTSRKDCVRLSPCKWPVHSTVWKKRYVDSSNKRVPGTVGIRNHGNTCFMNAVLQCLSHTEIFIEYFLTDEYKNELRMRKNQINKRFVGGAGYGELTEYFASVLKSLWASRYTLDIAGRFTHVVGKFSHQYRDRGQHDAQEFLLWLLDEIHEDLYIVSPQQASALKSKKKFQKPFKNRTETSLMTQHNVSEQQNSSVINPQCVSQTLVNPTPPSNPTSLLTNHSVVAALFQAQYRSSLTCAGCRLQSLTFDPFLCLSLSLPTDDTKPLLVTVVYADAKPRQVRLGLSLVNINDTISNLRETLSSDTNIPLSQIILLELKTTGLTRTYVDSMRLTDCDLTASIYAVETRPLPPELSPGGGRRHSQGGAWLQCVILNELVYGTRPSDRFGGPISLLLSTQSSYSEIQTSILNSMSFMLREGIQRTCTGNLLRIRIVNSQGHAVYLQSTIKQPLSSYEIERIMLTDNTTNGPPHVLLAIEWSYQNKIYMINPNSDAIEDHSSVRESQSVDYSSLHHCLCLSMFDEMLSADNAWHCPRCQMKLKGTIKRLSLHTLPDILIIHLKRFKQAGQSRTKMNSFISYPVRDLDMREFVASPGTDHVYDLYAVCNHYGNLTAGHYTAYCLNFTDSRWYEFDDSKVTLISEDAIVTCNAYLLFYQRQSMLKQHSTQRLFKNKLSESNNDNEVTGSDARVFLYIRFN